MANLHKSPIRKHRHDLLKFSIAYFPISVLITILLIILAYKDVLYLRFGTNFLGGSGNYSDNVTRLIADGFSKNLLQSIFGNLPFIALGMMLVLVAYSLMNTYKRTYESLVINKHYVNSKRIPASNIALMNIALRSASFTVPLLYWCFYLVVWFPLIAKLPLKYITNPSPLPIIATIIITILVLSLLTHIGIVISRLAIRLFKHI